MEDYFKLKYLQFNKDYFKNRLPKDVEIRLRRMQSRYGTIRIYDKKGTACNITGEFPFAKILLSTLETELQHLSTLKHEMVHLYCYIRGKNFGHTEYFWKLCQAIGVLPLPGWKICENVYGEEAIKLRREEVSNTMAKEKAPAVEKKTPGTKLLIDALKVGGTAEELAEKCGISINTVKVQISFHLKKKGYIIEKMEKDGKVAFKITGQNAPAVEAPKAPAIEA